MCRNIKTLYNFAPPADRGRIWAASLQLRAKLSGFNKPSKANEVSVRGCRGGDSPRPQVAFLAR